MGGSIKCNSVRGLKTTFEFEVKVEMEAANLDTMQNLEGNDSEHDSEVEKLLGKE